MPEGNDLKRHKKWLGYLQPVGVVVAPAALVSKGLLLNENVAAPHQVFCGLVKPHKLPGGDREVQVVQEFPAFAREVLDWSLDRLVGYAEGRPIPDELRASLTEYGEVLEPTYAIPAKQHVEGTPDWLLLVRVEQTCTDLDQPFTPQDRGWHASPQARFERLLRETGVPTGLLFNGSQFRLVFAPAKESSGHLTFPVSYMFEVSGRAIFGALVMLLEWERLVSVEPDENLPALLALSRKFQAEVSTALSEQVLAGLYELIRGLQAANDRTGMKLLDEVLKRAPNEVYEGLLTVLLRLIFILYAEDRGLMPRESVYQDHYSVAGLFGRLREDDALYPDTMDQRYGAWAQLLAVFRVIHAGARHGSLQLPARLGFLFDPDRYPFLEGRPTRESAATKELPGIPDGVVFRVLQKLLILNGERLSYRSLDVEEIGSVYERMMGFTLEVAQGPTIAVRAVVAHGAPTAVNLAELLKELPESRAMWLREQTDQSIEGGALAALKQASSPEEAVAALDKRVARTATPGIVPAKAMILRPSDERRRSGAHYTPRSFTAPIVQRVLEPILTRLGDRPTPAQILDLRVCDPAVGSGAFLVEVARQLGEVLVRSWHLHKQLPSIPPDEDELLHAKRLVAQQCLYGVDRNPIAADLAKLSLWLETLARNHDFTFLDHAIKHGDSLIGLSREQIESFHWDLSTPHFQAGFEKMHVREHMAKASALRRRIREADESTSDLELRELWKEAQREISTLRLFGDLVLAAFLEESSPKGRERKLTEFADSIVRGEAERFRAWVETRRYTSPPLVPFHWGIEFPEVFDRENPGFDAIVGNPPFLGGKLIAAALGDNYTSALKQLVVGAKGSCDLVGYFLRRCTHLVRLNGNVGIVATKTLTEGDTRQVALATLNEVGCSLYAATSPQPWPGDAGVHFITVTLTRGSPIVPLTIDGRPVSAINSRLQPSVEQADPLPLSQPFRPSSGTSLLGEGFILDPAERAELLRLDPRSEPVIKRFMNGEDLVRTPDSMPTRFVVDFGTRAITEAQCFVGAFERVNKLVRPQREALTRQIHEHRFWLHWDKRTELYESIAALERVIAFPLVSKYVVFAVVPYCRDTIFSHKVGVIPTDSFAAFSVLQSRAHVAWVTKYSSSRGVTVNYSISDCLTPFPWPNEFETEVRLIKTGSDFLEYRAGLMVRLNEGLTAISNRFHDPDEHDPEVFKLRELSASMDRAVLDAYGWNDIQTDCEFVLDYQIDHEEWGDKKKPYRYRWPDEVRDKVLARLFELNAARGQAEAASGANSVRPERKKGPRVKKPPPKRNEGDLFAGE